MLSTEHSLHARHLVFLIYYCFTPFIQDSSLVGSLLEESINGILPQSEEGELATWELSETVLDERVSVEVKGLIACGVPVKSDE